MSPALRCGDKLIRFSTVCALEGEAAQLSSMRREEING
jgi:hypothetical protein